MIFILVYLPSMVDFSNYYNNALSSYLYELEFEFEFKFSDMLYRGYSISIYDALLSCKNESVRITVSIIINIMIIIGLYVGTKTK